MCCERCLDFSRLSAVIQVAVVIYACAASAGCGNSGGRLTIAGDVTLDGEPLEKGSISFRPKPGTSSPSAGAAVSNGRFRVDGDKGVLAGEFQVLITATVKTGEQKIDPGTQMMMDEVEQILPARYNTESELQATIKADEKNELSFELRSD